MDVINISENSEFVLSLGDLVLRYVPIDFKGFGFWYGGLKGLVYWFSDLIITKADDKL